MKDPNHAAQRLLNHWRMRWSRDQTPKSTPVGEDNVIEVAFTSAPHGWGYRAASLTMLEMSGEDLEKILPEVNPAQVMASLYDYLKNPQISFVLVLVVDPGRPSAANGNMFQSLITYLRANFPGIEDRMALLVLLSKPDFALAQMRQNRRLLAEFPNLAYIHELDDDLTALYLRRFKQIYGQRGAQLGREEALRETLCRTDRGRRRGPAPDRHGFRRHRPDLRLDPQLFRAAVFAPMAQGGA